MPNLPQEDIRSAPNVAGDPLHYVELVQSLTSRLEAEEGSRRLQERLWRVSRLATMGEMASAIAHEINQPLAAIANYSQACDRLLARPDADIAEVREALREIAGQAVRAGNIIRKLRSITARADSPVLATDVNVLILELTDLVRSSLQTDNVDYQLQLGQNLPLMNAQPEEIQHVILNLVRNAIEAFPGDHAHRRQIIVRSARASDGDIEVTVCDNGPGVSGSISPNLFTPFCTSKDNGTGLGLAMSRTICARNGGTLTYRPNSPNGACFVVRLPAAASPTAPS